MVKYKTGDIVIRTAAGLEGSIGKITDSVEESCYHNVKILASQHNYAINAEDLWATGNFRLATKLELLLSGIDNV